jgi:hypothetical protein
MDKCLDVGDRDRDIRENKGEAVLFAGIDSQAILI